MKVVIAPDKFRGSLTAVQAASAIAAGVRRVRPDADLRLIPIADGGDGTVDAAVAAGFTPVAVTVRGPLGELVDARFASQGTTAVVELAEASGLRRLPGPPDPGSAVTASTFGTGQLIRAALDAGATRIVLGVGGSASTDGGAGLVTALGVAFLDGAGGPIGPGGVGLMTLAAIDRSGLDPRITGTEMVLATDVDNPLVGPHGAAQVYAPQKGADGAAVVLLDDALRQLAGVIRGATGFDANEVSGAGAAGGIGATVVPLLGAQVRSGSELLLDLLGVDSAVAGASFVITGEGSLDAQSLRGKAPLGVARAAARFGVPVVAVAGRVQVAEAELRDVGIQQAYSLSELEPDPVASMSRAAELLGALGELVAEQWLTRD